MIQLGLNSLGEKPLLSCDSSPVLPIKIDISGLSEGNIWASQHQKNGEQDEWFCTAGQGVDDCCCE